MTNKETRSQRIAAAQQTVEQAQIVRLPLEAQVAVADLLLDPPAPGPALERAFAAHRRLIHSL